MNMISIERLKAKRTKSYIIVYSILITGSLWMMMTVGRYINLPQFHSSHVIFYMVKEINSLLLPISISLFCSKIVMNEVQGTTFKLLLMNGQEFHEIFNQKLLFSSLVYITIAILETLSIWLISNMYSLSLNYHLLFLHVVSIIMISFSLVCLYLALSMFIQKQSIVVALGLLGGFFGIISSQAPNIIKLLLPWGHTNYLSLFNYEIHQNQFQYVFNQQIYISLIIYCLLMLVYYICAYRLMLKKGRYIK